MKLQYHMSNPNAADEFNLNNPADPSVRSFFYGVESPPSTIMNGFLGRYEVGDFNPFVENNFNGLFSKITPQVIEREALKAPKFKIDLLLDETNNDPALIEYRAGLTYMDSISTTFNEPVNVYLVLYESSVNGYRNVVRQMISGSGGITISQPWTWNPVATPTERTGLVDIKTQFADANNLYVVAFVQNRSTREIYQAVIQKVSKPKTQLLPVGLEEERVAAELEEIQLYPNPASNSVNMYSEGILSQQYSWKIINQQGVELKSGQLLREFFSPMNINTENLPDGVYFVVFGTKEKPIHYKKLVIVNRQ